MYFASSIMAAERIRWERIVLRLGPNKDMG